MKNKLWLLFTVALFVVVLVGCSSKEEIEAADSNELAQEKELEQPQQRIVATTNTVLEILDALEIDGVVGIPTTTQQIPERYSDAVEVGSAMQPDVEVIQSLQPTEVFSVTSLESDLKAGFDAVNFNSTFINLQSIGTMKVDIQEIAKRYNRQDKAEEVIAKIDLERANAIAKANELRGDKEGPKVLILLGLPGSYLISTENSYLADLVKLLGGTNAILGQNGEYLSSNTEFLQQSNPDVILRLSHAMPEEVVEMFDQEFATNDVWKHFDAVKNSRVYDLEESVFGTTAKLNMDEAYKTLIEILYGGQ